MTRDIRGAVAAAGVGLRYYKRGASPYSERALVLRAIVEACEDAGIAPSEIDGFCSFGEDHHDGPQLVNALGCKELRWSSMVWGGGGGGLAGAIEAGALAIAAGHARVVAIYRGLAERDSGRLSGAVSHSHMNAHFRAHGVISPAQVCALRVQRMLEHDGVPESAMLSLVQACYFHAARNPQAIGYGNSFDATTYATSRWISEPLRLFDCSRENDGSGAVVLVAAERAKDLKQPPVYVLAAAQGAPDGWGEGWENQPDYGLSGYGSVADQIWRRSGLGPSDVDVVQVYENFSGQAVASLIDHGFCAPEAAGEVLAFENLIAPDGRLPINTAGGNLGEGFVHGIGLAVEAVRQLRGQSANPVPDAETCLLIGGPATTVNSSTLFGAASAL